MTTTTTSPFKAIQAAASDAELEGILEDVNAAFERGDMDRVTVETLARLMVERSRQFYRLENLEYRLAARTHRGGRRSADTREGLRGASRLHSTSPGDLQRRSKGRSKVGPLRSI